MFEVLADRTYRHLFAAQLVALIGTGLATVALGLLAYEIAGADAGVVLGTALAIKMVAYIGVAPVVNAFVDRLPRRAFLVATDLIRAGVALCLPFVDQVWQIYLLIFVMQSCSAGFTPTFQAVIPDILPDERRYTRALSLSRLAYDMESVVSPILAASLLSVIGFHWLFAGTSVGFLLSAMLVVSMALPVSTAAPRKGGVWHRTTRGLQIYLKTPRLRGLLALNLAAAGGSLVIVNTILYVRTLLGRPENDVPLALAVFGAGSMLSALTLPRLLDRLLDRPVMLTAAGALVGTLTVAAFVSSAAGLDRWLPLLITWAVLGAAYSAILTPSGRLLRRSASPGDRSAVFAAQFALSHVCWLVTYLAAGWLGRSLGLAATCAVLALTAAAGLFAGLALWPRDDPEVVEHEHPDLAPDDPHLEEGHHVGGVRHAHAFVIDDVHPTWPQRAV